MIVDKELLEGELAAVWCVVWDTIIILIDSRQVNVCVCLSRLVATILSFVVLNPTENSKIEVTKTKWRPLVVEVGALGTLAGISNIVASVLAPLANCDVSVFCLSTNLDDFVLVSLWVGTG